MQSNSTSHSKKILTRRDPDAQPFMFATGIENSYPTIEWDGRTVRRDGMELSGHYDQWRHDFAHRYYERHSDVCADVQRRRLLRRCCWNSRAAGQRRQYFCDLQ